jgi:hypothetical protein
MPTSELMTLPPEAHDAVEILGRQAQVSVFRRAREEGGCIVAVQGFLPTWWRPTYISLDLQVVGRLVAEGLIVSPEGAVEDAPDEVMWAFR